MAIKRRMWVSNANISFCEEGQENERGSKRAGRKPSEARLTLKMQVGSSLLPSYRGLD